MGKQAARRTLGQVKDMVAAHRQVVDPLVKHP